jgi:WD40 repeat protein
VVGDGLAAMQGALADHCVRFTADGCELLDGSAWTLEHLPWHLMQAGRRADGRRALSWADEETLRLWNLESGEAWSLRGHFGPVFGAQLLPDGGRALSWSGDLTLRLWDLETGGGRLLRGHDGPVLGAQPLPDSRHALSWSDDLTLRLWDLAECHEVNCFIGDDPITTVVLSAHPQLLLAGDVRGRIMVFELPP